MTFTNAMTKINQCAQATYNNVEHENFNQTL